MCTFDFNITHQTVKRIQEQAQLLKFCALWPSLQPLNPNFGKLVNLIYHTALVFILLVIQVLFYTSRYNNRGNY